MSRRVHRGTTLCDAGSMRVVLSVSAPRSHLEPENCTSPITTPHTLEFCRPAPAHMTHGRLQTKFSCSKRTIIVPLQARRRRDLGTCLHPCLHWLEAGQRYNHHVRRYTVKTASGTREDVILQPRHIAPPASFLEGGLGTSRQHRRLAQSFRQFRRRREVAPPPPSTANQFPGTFLRTFLRRLHNAVSAVHYASPFRQQRLLTGLFPSFTRRAFVSARSRCGKKIRQFRMIFSARLASPAPRLFQ